jgi:hypothetical protein
MTNLSISPGRKWASFINTIFKSKDHETYQLFLYNLSSGELKIIDSAKYENNELLGESDKYNSTLWTDSSTLLYYKLTNKKGSNGCILMYNLATGKTSVRLENTPSGRLAWFDFFNGYFYFSTRHGLYRTKNGSDNEMVYYDKKNNISAAVIH